MAAVAAAAAGAAVAQVAPPARLVGKIVEQRGDIRPDAGGELLGLMQGPASFGLDMAELHGLLPQRKAAMTVCFRARSADGTYFANGELSAPPGDEPSLPVEAPGFPRIAIEKGVHRSNAEELAVMFYATPCGGRNSVAYPASFGKAGNVITAAVNLGSLRDTPQARLVPKASKQSTVEGTCRRLEGRSTSFNVLCQFALPAGFAGGPHTISIDYAPQRNPKDTAELLIWAAPFRP